MEPPKRKDNQMISLFLILGALTLLFVLLLNAVLIAPVAVPEWVGMATK